MLYFEFEEGKVYDVKDAAGMRKYQQVVNDELMELKENTVKGVFA